MTQEESLLARKDGSDTFDRIQHFQSISDLPHLFQTYRLTFILHQVERGLGTSTFHA